MESTQLFEMALGLSGGWKVVGSKFEGEPKRLEILLDFEVGSRLRVRNVARCAGHMTRWKSVGGT